MAAAPSLSPAPAPSAAPSKEGALKLEATRASNPNELRGAPISGEDRLNIIQSSRPQKSLERWVSQTSQVRRNAPPATPITGKMELHDFADPKLAKEGGPKISQGYYALPPEHRHLLNIDRDKLLKTEHQAQQELGADFRFSRGGPRTSAEIKQHEADIANGVQKPIFPGKINRSTGELIQVYDRSLYAEAMQQAVDKDPSRVRDGVVLPVPNKYASPEMARNCIVRSLKFLGADEATLASAKTESMDKLASVERRLMMERVARNN